MPLPQWKEVLKDERVKALAPEKRLKLAGMYFDNVYANDERFLALDKTNQDVFKKALYDSAYTTPEKGGITKYGEDIAEGYRQIGRDPNQALADVMFEAPAISQAVAIGEGVGTLATMGLGFMAGMGAGVGEAMNQVMAGDGDFDWKRIQAAKNQVMEDFVYQPEGRQAQTYFAEPPAKVFEVAINTTASAVTSEPVDDTPEAMENYEQEFERNKFFVEAGLLVAPFIAKKGSAGIAKVRHSRNVKQLRKIVDEGYKEMDKNLDSAIKKMNGKQELSAKEKYAVENEAELTKIRDTIRVDEPLVTPEAGLSTEVIKGERAPEGFKSKFPDVEKRYQDATIKEPTMREKVGNAYDALKKNITRGTVAELPRTGKFAPLRDSIQKLQRQKGVAVGKTINAIESVTQSLIRARDIEGYNLFTRKVILEDLASEAKAGRELPYGYTPERVGVDLARLNKELESNPQSLQAYERRGQVMTAIKDDYVKAMQDIGIDLSEKMNDKSYFRHQVLDYVQSEGLYGTGQRLQAPTGRSFGKKRQGSLKDINRDYIQAESEVMAQMLYDTEVAKVIKLVDREYNIADTSKGVIPRGYAEWQPREGNVFYRSHTIPEKIAMTAMEKEIASVAGKDVGSALVMGGRRKTFIVPEEVANALDGMSKSKKEGFVGNIDKKILKGWKQWQLISPRRFAKYNARNVTGDADAVFVGNPSGFKKVPSAVSELYDYMALKKTPTPELQAWLDRGGMEGTLQAQEMASGINELKSFAKLHKPRKAPITSIPARTWKKYWEMARGATDFREAILRYANFKDYREQITRDGRPKEYGASLREEVNALPDVNDKAYKMANELLGAYDDISPAGQFLREHMIPFWSWNEVNMKRYARFAKNAYLDGKSTAMLGRKTAGLAIKSPLIAYRTGKFAVKASALWAGLQAYNNTVFPELEAQLPEAKRARPHIIFGRDSDGKIITFDRLGALGDFLEWFGLDAAPQMVDRMYKGKLTVKEAAKEMAISPVNKMAQGMMPFSKTGFEVATGRALFPDITKPRTIRNRKLHIARSLGLENEYKAIAGLPSRPYGESAWNLLTYKIHPGEAAMGDVYELKRKYMESIGKSGSGFWQSPKGNAIYNLKLAIKLEDKDAANKYFDEYMSYGGTPSNIYKSFNSMNPIYGIKDEDMPGFLEYIGPEGKERLTQALDYFIEIKGKATEGIVDIIAEERK
jgi:hypothetical protein